MRLQRLATAAVLVLAFGIGLAAQSGAEKAQADIDAVLVDRPIELYSGHAIRREGSAYDQRMGVAVLL